MEYFRKFVRFGSGVCLVLGAIFIRTYLRILNFCYSQKSTKAETEYLSWSIIALEYTLNFLQKLNTYWTLWFFISYFLQDKYFYTNIIFTFGIILTPRILFSIYLIAPKFDYNRDRELSINRKVNLSLKGASTFHQMIQRIFSVLNVHEHSVVIVLEKAEYVAFQLLGYNYSENLVLFYSELESMLTIPILLYLYTLIQNINFMYCLVLQSLGFAIRVLLNRLSK